MKRAPSIPGEETLTQCVYCGEQLNVKTITRDHVIPVVRGGAKASHNIAPACLKCNTEKGPLTANEYLNARHNKILLAAKVTEIQDILARRRASKTGPLPPNVDHPAAARYGL